MASVAGAAALAAGVGVPLVGAAGTKSLSDPAGDAGAGFDITAFAVSNDDAGRISFRVDLPAVTALPSNMALLILLDTDLNTNESNPFDYGITIIRDTAVMFPIAPAGIGTSFVPRSLTTRFEPGVVNASVARAEIGAKRVLLASVTSFTLNPCRRASRAVARTQ